MKKIKLCLKIYFVCLEIILLLTSIFLISKVTLVKAATGTPLSSVESLKEYLAGPKGIYLGSIAIGGGLAIIMIVWAGYEYAMSAGDPEQIKGAKEKIVGAVLGLLLLLLASLLLDVLRTT